MVAGYDCTVLPSQNPTDPAITFQAMPGMVLDATKAMAGSCTLDVTAVDATGATGTCAVTAGNGTDPDYACTNGQFSFQF